MSAGSTAVGRSNCVRAKPVLSLARVLCKYGRPSSVFSELITRRDAVVKQVDRLALFNRHRRRRRRRLLVQVAYCTHYSRVAVSPHDTMQLHYNNDCVRLYSKIRDWPTVSVIFYT